MKLLTVNLNNKELNKILKNSVEYSYGFLDGIQMEKIEFNRLLGGYTVEALEKYIDARARINPQALHHVYEWNRVGDEKARLYKFNVKANATSIKFSGSFLPSKSFSPTSDEPFTDKANIMENGISIVVEPKKSNVLVFESDGDTVFTRRSITIEHPGGDEVAGSFGRTVDSFFENYFTNALLKPFIQNLQNAKEYSKNFSSGAKGGRAVGIRAGRQYLRNSGVVIE